MKSNRSFINSLLGAFVFVSVVGKNNGQVIVELRAEDIVTLVNVTGATAVGLASKIGGDQVNVNASITILKLNS
jgi:hypothetical protein